MKIEKHNEEKKGFINYDEVNYGDVIKIIENDFEPPYCWYGMKTQTLDDIDYIVDLESGSMYDDVYNYKIIEIIDDAKVVF